MKTGIVLWIDHRKVVVVIVKDNVEEVKGTDLRWPNRPWALGEPY